MTPLQCWFFASVQLMNETDVAIEDLALHFGYKQHAKSLEFLRNETLLGTPACTSYIQSTQQIFHLVGHPDRGCYVCFGDFFLTTWQFKGFIETDIFESIYFSEVNFTFDYMLFWHSSKYCRNHHTYTHA